MFEHGTAGHGRRRIHGHARAGPAGDRQWPRIYIDGGASIRCRSTRWRADNEIIVAVDVAGGPAERKLPPEPMETMLGASLIMQGAIVAEKLKARAPDMLVRPQVDGFRGLDFFKAKAILQAAEPARKA